MLQRPKQLSVSKKHAKYGGLSDYVLHAVFGIEGIKFDAIHLPDKFLRSYGTYQEHCENLGFTAENLVNKVKLTCKVGSDSERVPINYLQQNKA